MLLAALLAGAPALATAEPPAGDAQRGADILHSRSSGLCVLCHAVPGVPSVQAGTLVPDLAGVGARYSRAQLRERLESPQRFNPDTVMPSVSRSDGFQRVAAARAGQPLLSQQQLEDLLSHLETLR